MQKKEILPNFCCIVEKPITIENYEFFPNDVFIYNQNEKVVLSSKGTFAIDFETIKPYVRLTTTAPKELVRY